jgi:hypothetical protein
LHPEEVDSFTHGHANTSEVVVVAESSDLGVVSVHLQFIQQRVAELTVSCILPLILVV